MTTFNPSPAPRRKSLPKWAVAAIVAPVVLTGSAFAQSFGDDVNKALASYQAKNYEAALQQFSAFKTQYGADPGFPPLASRIDYLMALSMVQLKQWGGVPEMVDAYEKDKALAPDKGNPAWSEELMFWKGRALSNTSDFAGSRKVYEDFLKQYPGSKKVATVQLLLAQTLIQAEQWNDAAELLAKLRASATGVEWGRLLLLETHARISAGQTDKALALVDEGHRNWRRLGQITAFELLAIHLAEKLMEEPDKSRALVTLIRVQPRDALLKLQDQQLADLQKYADTLKKQDPTSIDSTMAAALVEQVKKEREQFAKLENFDSSVRFRIAQVFLDQQRYRETAYVLETMLDQLPPDAIVEQGSVTLAECYTHIERSDKVIEVVDKFMQKFPNAKEMPSMLLQKGIALQNLHKLPESSQVFADFLSKYPNDPLAPNAAFLSAFNKVLSEDYLGAAKAFHEVQQKYASSSVAPNALFWEAQAYSLGKQSDLALPLYEAYLAKYPNGESMQEARYRHAYSLYDLRNYDKGVPELEKFVKENPTDPNSAEGLLLLGDAYFMRHEYDKAIRTLLSIPKGVGTNLEEAYFKVGKYYKLADDNDKLRALFQRFQVEFPNSARLSDAIYQIGLSYANDPAKQREIFWSAFDRFGNEPKQWGITSILQALVKASSTPETHDELIKRLTDIAKKAGEDKKRTLQLNAEWGLAAAERPTDPIMADRTLIAAAPIIDAETDNPSILMDIAAAFQRNGKLDDASKIYAEVRRWNPVSTFNQNIFANLGLIAFDEKKYDEAQRYFDRYFNETSAVEFRGQVMLKSAELQLANGKMDKALDFYEKALADKTVAQEQKANALLAVGNIYLDRKDTDKAIAYFQRIYVLYGGFPAVAAQAYLQSGKAFEAKGDSVAAARTYTEMLHAPSFADAKFAVERNEAQKRLDKLPADARKKAEDIEKKKLEADQNGGGAG